MLSETMINSLLKNILIDYLDSEILKSIKDIAQNYVGKEIHRALITVPAFFNKNPSSFK